MTITFSVEGIEEEHGYELPCPDCGLSMNDVVDTNSPGVGDCPECSGYGGPSKMPEVRYELNVSNVNAAALLVHLGIGREPGGGAADPIDVLAGLCSRSPAELVTDLAYQVLPHGRDLRIVAHYYSRLTRIAKMALKYERQVVWS